jgi:hypothetical protein
MLQIIMRFIEGMREAVSHRIPLYRIMELGVLEDIHRMKYAHKGDDPAPFHAILERIEEELAKLLHREVRRDLKGMRK